MFFNVSYLLAAKSLLDRRKNQLDSEISHIEKEREDFFYWVLTLLERAMHASEPYKVNFEVNIIEVHTSDFAVNISLMEEKMLHGGLFGPEDEYTSRLFRNQFIADVARDVVDLFNKIGELTNGSFSAELSTNEDNLLTMRVCVTPSEEYRPF